MKNWFLSGCVLLGFAGPVVGYTVMAAEPTRKVDFSKPLLDVKGEPFHACADPRPECKRVLKLGEVIALALNNVPPEGDKADALTKLRKSMLSIKIYGGGRQELTVDETKLILDTMKESPQPMVYFRTMEAVAPGELPK